MAYFLVCCTLCFSFSWKFVFNQVEPKFINATTWVQFQKRCTSVSCSALQNEQISLFLIPILTSRRKSLFQLTILILQTTHTENTLTIQPIANMHSLLYLSLYLWRNAYICVTYLERIIVSISLTSNTILYIYIVTALIVCKYGKVKFGNNLKHTRKSRHGRMQIMFEKCGQQGWQL